ncbi:hypothetical protein [Methylobacterium nigriterrae]|uniref:hypothetical protein n=1 Tax=Methylobacterium nigriterrae TaxID=3127512 RepID=UPI0030137A59
MPNPFTIVISGCLSAVVIAGLTLLADASTRAQLDRALKTAARERPLALASGSTLKPVRSLAGSALDKRRLEATILMVSRPGEETN